MAELDEVIPTIDLKEIPDKILNQKIREASERWGCFRVINHGVSLSLMCEMKKTVRELHELPLEVKMLNTDVLLGGGYKPRSDLNPLYESFGVFDMASPQVVNTFCDQLEASANQREIILKYGKSIDGLARDLARRLGESYQIAETDFFKEWPSQLRMNKYHFKPETIVLQGDENVGGLEAMDTSSRTFFPINTLLNTLTINLGDTATHRVQCKEATVRISISSFLLGPMDRGIEPPSEFVDAEHPRLYKPVTDEELRKIRLSPNLRTFITI
ncbi:unnamed protein product [Arabis nemorensis]|uniref:Non-haem dioxygenase N-terminal domain-containing protein n=1 Tax=Arabis nemorensis TaxID=586526 RepID=A0A565API3_9BRAS|nr:unnamed protein product [Arabis nemorensis]